jgi:4-amino-4-deoxy-L-arabinose transferase-like glycosyltransferase
MKEDKVNVFIRIGVSMSAIGVAMGAASWFVYEWIVAVNALGENESLVLPLIPLILLMIVAASAPAIAGILGIFEGLRGANLERSIVAAGSCLIGGVLMVVLAAVFIGQIDPPSSGSGGVSLMDIVSVAGLVGIMSGFAGSITTVLTKK